MGKAKSFADKAAKNAQDFTVHCPQCGESKTFIKLVKAERSEKTGAYKFRHKLVGMCKCNESKIIS